MYEHLSTPSQLLYYEPSRNEELHEHRGPFPKKIVATVMSPQSAWFDKNGLMTKIKGPNFFDQVMRQASLDGHVFSTTIDQARPNRIIGTYTAPQHRLVHLIDGQLESTVCVDSFGPDAKPLPGDAIYRFSISNKAIHQEIDGDRLFILESNGSARIMGANRALEMILRKVLVLKDADHPEKGYDTEYVATRYLSMVPIRRALDQIPATVHDLLEQLGENIHNLVRRIGYREEIDDSGDDWENHRFYWTLRLHYEANDTYDCGDSAKPWHLAVPDDALIALWHQFVSFKNTIYAMSKSDRLEPSLHEKWLQKLQGFNEQALAALDARFPHRN